MLAAERRKKICEILEEHDAVRVTELSSLFSVTEETIRRDLEKLERENKVIRQHGGAIKYQTTDSEVHFTEREIIYVNEKRVIAKHAATLVNEGDTIMLDASTTAWYLANSLPNIPIIVITNSVQVINELISKDRIEVISTGGRYSAKSHSFVGPLSERSIMNYHVNKTFISCTGAHIMNGVSDSSELQAILKSLMIANSDEVILMMDSSKSNKPAFAHVTDIEKIDYLITDSKVDSKFKIQVEELGVNIIIAE
ncbi:DeoR/GlpR family DNA-binding transcription regulator [Solibacillus silvestris]|uniref:DeoR/GlpR family DNA-binding transcription regulator n=1 Tax=Solibacillus silvestris TaxID=76853 RepID=UPI003F7F07F7